jgi:hypothetical protein
MRPYLVLSAVILMAAVCFGQALPYPGGCYYGCGPYVPRITTPEIDLQQYSPNPVGASNATTGLIAGATNSTLTQVNGPTNSVWTVPVWVQGGGAPVLTPEVSLFPERLGREGHIQHEAFRPEPPRPEFAREFAREDRFRDEHVRELHEMRERDEHAAGRAEWAHVDWVYISGPTPNAEATAAPKAGHVYTNDDVKRQNDKNGNVKYDDHTEKLQ